VRRRPAAPLSGWRWWGGLAAGSAIGLVTSGVLVLASLPVLYGAGRRTQPG
jgi:hypothetical protein